MTGCQERLTSVTASFLRALIVCMRSLALLFFLVIPFFTTSLLLCGVLTQYQTAFVIRHISPVFFHAFFCRSSHKGEDVVVCLPGARIEHVTARVEKIMGRGKGGTILVHIGTNNADKEGTTAIVDKYSKLLKKTKEARVGQIILSGILPVFGNRIDGYRNSKRMAINGMVKRLCKEEDVGYVDLWDSFVGKEEMYLRDGLHLSGKGAAVFAEGLSGAVASGLGQAFSQQCVTALW